MRFRTRLGMILMCGCAHAEQVALHAPITTFGPNALGGIRTIIRYAVPRPDKSETDYLLLGDDSNDPAEFSPVAIQVEGPHGDAITLSDVEGADCTLARTAIFRTGTQIILVRATRADEVAKVMSGSFAQPGAMTIRVYRRLVGGEPGQSSPMFKAEDASTSTKPICSATEVEQAIDTAARSAQADGPSR